MHGKGKLTDLNGKTKHGTWENGKRIDWKENGSSDKSSCDKKFKSASMTVRSRQKELGNNNKNYSL